MIALGFGALASSACVSIGGGSSELDSKLARYVGLPKEQILAQLGSPRVETDLDDRVTLAWISRAPRTWPTTTTTVRTTGSEPGLPPVGILVPAGGGSLSDSGCELRLVMSADGQKAEATRWSGNQGLCLTYLKTLERQGGRVRT
jgi:hypothetical protein